MTVKIETEFAVETCIECGIDFAFPKGFQDQLRKNHRTMYCPNGHQQYYPQQTEEEKLRKQLRQAKDEAYDERLARYKAENQLGGALDKINKMKKRANAGLCPYCRRHFANVERHIKCKHKDKAR